MSKAWGSMVTDYIVKQEGACARCSQKRYKCMHGAWLCAADCDIKDYYKQGRTKKAMHTLRSLPTESLKDYLPEERRTPTELVAVILDELQAREKEETPRL